MPFYKQMCSNHREQYFHIVRRIAFNDLTISSQGKKKECFLAEE